MARYRFKAFNPKPFEPGARIEWDHSTLSGLPPVRRSGVVWSAAAFTRSPGGGGRNGRAVWVIPDESLPGDLYRAIYVLIPLQSEHFTPDQLRPHSTDDPRYGGGRETAYAARVAERTRRDNARNRAA